MNASKSRFVWHEYLGLDARKATAFYAELFAWKVREVDMAPGTYRILTVGSIDVGGIMQLDAKRGAPPHWLGYVGVDDVDAVVARALAAGGRVIAPRKDIPKVGTFAILADPQGGVIAPFRPSEAEAPEPAGRPAFGAFVWDELRTTDPKAALVFYKAAFGWTYVTRDMGPLGTYYMLRRGEKDAGGLMKAPPSASGSQSAHWLSYVHVESVDATAKRVETLGGKILSPPADIPEVGRAAIVTDSLGAAFALFK